MVVICFPQFCHIEIMKRLHRVCREIYKHKGRLRHYTHAQEVATDPTMWVAVCRVPCTTVQTHQQSETSGCRRDADETCTLLGYYAASSCNPLPTFRDNLSVPSSMASCPLKMQYTRCAETSVKDYHSTLRNIAEECRSQTSSHYSSPRCLSHHTVRLKLTQNMYKINLLKPSGNFTYHQV
jgi:hypothetical protein